MYVAGCSVDVEMLVSIEAFYFGLVLTMLQLKSSVICQLIQWKRLTYMDCVHFFSVPVDALLN